MWLWLTFPPPSCLPCVQLDKLRTIIESMLGSSSTLLSLSISPHRYTNTLVPGQLDPEATCPACSLDVGHQVSLLVQRYEQLQDMVNGLAASRPSKKAKLQSQVSLCSAPSQAGRRPPGEGCLPRGPQKPERGTERGTGISRGTERGACISRHLLQKSEDDSHKSVLSAHHGVPGG